MPTDPPRVEPTGTQRAAELALSLAALTGSLVLNNWAGRMADAAGLKAHSSPDLLLSWLPVVDTRLVFVWGFAVFLTWLIVASIWRERRRIPYIIWSYALLIAVRCFFIILTPMRQPYEAIQFQSDFLFHAIGRYLTFRHDLFFSSHTALPFLGCLLLRGRWLRASFFLLSVVMACAVLLGRLHYSIDVFGAYFMTYAVHKAEVRWFQPYYNKLKLRWLAR